MNYNHLAGRAKALHKRRMFAAARATLELAHSINPNPELDMFRGQMEMDAEDYVAASYYMNRALKSQPNNAKFMTELGSLCISLNKIGDAESLLAQAIETDGNVKARLELAFAKLVKGEWDLGWKMYEARRDYVPDMFPKLPGPEWRGEDLNGKSIYVKGEQGQGDQIMLARYLPWLANQGAEVHLSVGQRLVTLFLTNPPLVHKLYIKGALEPKTDYCVYMGSLPMFHGTTPNNVPPQASIFRSFKDVIIPPSEGRLKIGLVWSGHKGHARDKQRSILLEQLLPITGRKDVKCYSIQLEPGANDVSTVGAEALVADLGEILIDWQDTAAVIQQMDLVITVDTAVAHLSGSMDKPTWILLPLAPDFRWLLTRKTTPWYPSVRLFRQEQAGVWRTVINEVLQELDLLKAGVRGLNENFSGYIGRVGNAAKGVHGNGIQSVP